MLFRVDKWRRGREGREMRLVEVKAVSAVTELYQRRLAADEGLIGQGR
jgi:hypothetical protein